VIVERASAADAALFLPSSSSFLNEKKKMMSGLSDPDAIRPKGNHRVRFEQSWVELSSSLRKRTARRRTAITESERSDSEWLYRTSSGSESCSSSAATHPQQL
jgi:hypothetical protein